MKKRIFTLLALGMLIGGFSSALNAQVVVTEVNVGYTTNTFPTDEVYEVKAADDAKKTKLTTSRTHLAITVRNAGLIAKDTTILFRTLGAADYLGLPESITIKAASAARVGLNDTTYLYDHNQDWNMPNSASGTEGIVQAYVKGATLPSPFIGDTAAYFNYPTFTVEYRARTAQYKGSLRISNIVGSNPELYDNDYTNGEMERELTNDDYIHFRTDSVVLYPFSDTEVASITYGDGINVYARWETYNLTIPGMTDPGIPGTMYRAVTVPVVDDAVINREPGVHQVPSTKDFTFIITPTGSNAGKIPVVTTGRTTVPDSEGVKYEELTGGSWLVTIKQVQTAINLSISFIVSNTDIESTGSAWANGGQLYVNALASGNANVYSITGALVKTFTLSAGETASESLPTGFYVVTINGKAYKVTIK